MYLLRSVADAQRIIVEPDPIPIPTASTSTTARTFQYGATPFTSSALLATDPTFYFLFLIVRPAFIFHALFSVLAWALTRFLSR